MADSGSPAGPRLAAPEVRIGEERAAGPAPARPAAGRRGSRPVIALYAVTLLVSAALLFCVQPMFARFVLPLLGGTPAVWNVSMVFFQVALLAGYLYAHWSIRRFGPRRQALLHLALLLPPLLVLPIGVPEGWVAPQRDDPILWLLVLLAVSVGLPFFVVASTAPLLQRWLAATDHPRAADPYVLYRASNTGSVIGLLGYPALMEPYLRLGAQGRLWALGYGALVVLIAGCALVLWRSKPVAGEPADGRVGAALADGASAGSLAAAGDGAGIEPDAAAAGNAAAVSGGGHGAAARASARVGEGRPSLWRGLWWAGLAFVPSSLLLGVTSFLTTDLAPMPLLWAIPLGLYLVSFIAVFTPAGEPAPAYRAAVVVFPILAVSLMVLLTGDVRQPFVLVMLAHLATFTAAALVCHGRLAANRPHPRHLTAFYLWISLGGALGGAFNALVAPVAFDALTEYPLVLVVACLCLPVRDRRSGPYERRLDLAMPLGFGVALLGALLILGGGSNGGRGTALHLVSYCLVGIVCLLQARRPLRFGLGVGAILAVSSLVATIASDAIVYRERSFFGVLEVRSGQGGRYHNLSHGTTLHGAELTEPGRRPVPLTYYHPTGPAGDLVRAMQARGRTRRVAVVGLGAGTMACHSRAGERWTFLEIDPTVERIARDPRLFTYLRDCPGSFDVVLGDGRISLARSPERRYDLIVLDAFSSDAIPVHLLTKEAVELYQARLEDGGVLAFHISNRFVDLEPVLGDLAQATGMTCMGRFDYSGVSVGEAIQGKSASHWLALGRRPADLGRLATDAGWLPCTRGGSEPWTDDYSDVLTALLGGTSRRDG
jgi:hypothetical protein